MELRLTAQNPGLPEADSVLPRHEADQSTGKPANNGSGKENHMAQRDQSTRKRTGYQFEGFYVDEARTRRLNPGALLEDHLTVYDKWVPVQYEVTYDLPYGINSRRNPRFVTIESGVTKLYPPRLSDKDPFFLGWFWNGRRVEYLPEGLHEAVFLEARFSNRPVVSFDTGAGGRVAPKAVEANGLLANFTPPMRMGYTFGGWFLDPELEKPFSFRKPVLQDLTLHAAWLITHYGIRYELHGGSFVSEPVKSFTYETETFFLPEPVRKGYKFCGWTDGRGRPVSMIAQHTNGGRIVHATWKEMSPEVHVMASKKKQS